MTREIVVQFSRALHRGFGTLPYGIIGLTAFSQYCLDDFYPGYIDVIVSPEICDRAIAQLLRGNVGIISLDEDPAHSTHLG
jgi:hypothetical protein